jgi:hypothetical protein
MTTENGIDRTIVEWWQATEALTDLVPADRVATEIMQADEAIAEDDDGDLIFDDCVVLEISTEPHWRTNSVRSYQTTVTFAAMSIDDDRADLIARTIVSQWADQSFGSISDCRPDGTIERQQDEETGIYQITATLVLNHVGV